MVFIIWLLSWLVFFFFVSLRQATAIREEGTSVKNLDWPMVGFLFCFSFWLMIDVGGSQPIVGGATFGPMVLDGIKKLYI